MRITQGLIEVREKSKISETDELLVTEENEDRMFIYQSISEQNNLPEEILEDIQRVFAKERQECVGTGVWIQLSDGR